MAYSQVKISQLPSATALTGPELFETVQGGVNKKVTATQISTFAGGSFWPFAGTGTATGNITIEGADNELHIHNFQSVDFESNGGGQSAFYIDSTMVQFFNPFASVDLTNNGFELVIPAGSDFRIGGDPGISGYTIKSNGPNNPITWGPDSGTGSVNTFPKNAQSGNYTLQQSDTVLTILMSSVSDQTLTIPTGMKGGSIFMVLQDSTNTVTLDASAVTVDENTSGTLTLTKGFISTIYYKNSTRVVISKNSAATGGGSSFNHLTPNIETGDYTALPADTISITYMRHASTPQTFTIPLNDLPVGSLLTVVQDSTAVTTVEGEAGVDIIGATVLTTKETAVYHQRETNKWVRLGAALADYTRNAVAISSGTLTLDLNSLQYRNFDLTATVSGAFTIALTNEENVSQFHLSLRVTGAVAVSMPTGTKMMRSETNAGRWVQGSPGILTLTGATASTFRLVFTYDGSSYMCEASNL